MNKLDKEYISKMFNLTKEYLTQEDTHHPSSENTPLFHLINKRDREFIVRVLDLIKEYLIQEDTSSQQEDTSSQEVE